jgi:type IV pilus assembly protein PilP
MVNLLNNTSRGRMLWIMGISLFVSLSLGFFSHALAVENTSPSIPSKSAETASQQDSPAKGPYVYNPEGKLDPFRPFIDALASKQQQRPEVLLTPLQRFNITQLKLVGIIRSDSETKALIQDPSNKGYIIDVGTLIGPNWGKVAEITPSQVIIAEEQKDALGRVSKQKIIMNLHAAGEEQPG